MRVLIVTNIYPSARFPAQGAWLAEQVRSLRNRGLSVHVLSFDPGGLHLAYGQVIPRLVRIIRSRHWNLIHTHHTYTILLSHFARRLAHSKIGLVGTIHEQEALDPLGARFNWKLTERLRHSIRIKRLAARLADSTVVVSQELADVVRPPQPYEVIPCGVDMSRFVPMDRLSCRRLLRIDPGAFVVFWPSDPRARRKREELARRSHEVLRRMVSGAVLVLGGSIQHYRMPQYYNAADVVLQTSALEVSPTIVKEALACEVPLVSTRAGDTEETCRGLPNCVICSDDAAELAEAMMSCWRTRVVGGRARLESLGLELDQVAERLIGLYHRTLVTELSA